MTFPNILQNRAVGPRIQRVRHELKFRGLQVESIVRLTPGMLRISFSGQDLSDFVSAAPDDHVKIFAPTPSGEVERRDYTPRRYDARARLLVIDFAVHDAGPATRWALNARPGDRLQIGGPRGSAVASSDIRRWVLIGDETALPAIGRRIEEAKAGTHITSVVSVTGPDEHQAFETPADLRMLWAYRPLSAANDPGALLSIVKSIDLQPETFVWIAAEAAVARAIRTHFLEQRGQPLSWTKASGYWVVGRADAHEKFE
jgi:NADPH-dependent ferric siderophore reductase